jgi:uncharacterized membrane protein YgcG
MVPAFRAGDFSGGINAALDRVFARVRGDVLPAPKENGHGSMLDEVPWLLLVIMLLAVVPLLGGGATQLFGRFPAAALTALVAGAIFFVGGIRTLDRRARGVRWGGAGGANRPDVEQVRGPCQRQQQWWQWWRFLARRWQQRWRRRLVRRRR